MSKHRGTLPIAGLGRRAFLQGAAVSGAAIAFTPPAWAQFEEGGKHSRAEPKMSFIANSQVRLGIDLARGGAITYLADLRHGGANMINSFDLGRQVQMSYYSGPVPYRVKGHAGPRPIWEQIGWNPIQVGDDFGNSSRIVEHRNDGREIYVKCVPMQWPLDNVPGECTFESWLRLEGNVVRARCRLVMNRTDRTQWPARYQELPAVYTNGPWYDLVTYRGDAPFTGGEVDHISHPFTTDSPWTNWGATENWAAMVDRTEHGVGVWSPGNVLFSGGFYGAKGAGGVADAPTGYIAPNRMEIIDHDIVHDYSYALVCGDVSTIRQWVYAQPRRSGLPRWTFKHDRQGWSYVNAVDSGWPIRGRLNIRSTGDAAAQVVGPVTTWQASEGHRVILRGRFDGVSAIQFYWRQLKPAYLEEEPLVTDPAAVVQVAAGAREVSAICRAARATAG